MAGIVPLAPVFSVFGVRPVPAHLSHIRATVPLSGGREIGFRLERDSRECTIVLDVPRETRALFFVPVQYSRIWIDGEERHVEVEGVALQPGRRNIVLR